MSDFWKILEIAPTTDRSVIKRAYAALAKNIIQNNIQRSF